MYRTKVPHGSSHRPRYDYEAVYQRSLFTSRVPRAKLKRADARTREALVEVMGEVLSALALQRAWACFARNYRVEESTLLNIIVDICRML
jgi:hypothetical protein